MEARVETKVLVEWNRQSLVVRWFVSLFVLGTCCFVMYRGRTHD